MDQLEQEEEEAKKEGRGGKNRKKTNEEEEVKEKEEDVEDEEPGPSAELDQYRAQVMELPITSRKRELEGLLRKLVTYFWDNLDDQLCLSERPSRDVLAEVEKEVQEQLEKVKVLIGAGAGKVLADFHERKDFLKYYIRIRNEKVLNICQGILDVLINEDNAQTIFGKILVFLNGPSSPHLNYRACCNLLKWCVDRSARPNKCKIKDLMIRKIFSNSEILFAFLQLMEQLIETHRKHGNSDPIRIYLNPIQDLYEVSEDLRLAAGRVIRAAYLSLSKCMDSGSLINTLLFLDSGVTDDDDAVIKEWFEKADFPLRRDMKYPLFIIRQIRKKKLTSDRQFPDELSRRNDNWLQRSVLHLVAIFVHNDQVLNLIPKEYIEKAKYGRDLHGCTPLHTAYLHGNKSVILLLESYEAKLNAVADYFGRTPESFKVPYEYSEDNYTEYCRNITTAKYSVFATMKKMLILPIKECEAIEENFKILFEMMVSRDGLLNATVKIAGSVREKLKVGRFNEVDVQIRMKRGPFDSEPFPGISLHEHLVKRMAGIDWSLFSLRPVSVVFDAPWKFIWDREGTNNGLVISVDIVPIYINIRDVALREEERMNLNLVVKNAPDHEMHRFLKNNLSCGFMSIHTICEHEWDILDNLPPGCRLGILIAKALLAVLDQVSDNDTAFTKAPITSYVIKNTVFWILAGKTPQYPQNVIGERYGHLKQQLDFKGIIPTWTTEEDLANHAEEGRLWAETIFDAIHFLAKNCGKKFGSFLVEIYYSKDVSSDELYDMLDTCERCLERLRPCIFFDKDNELASQTFALS